MTFLFIQNGDKKMIRKFIALMLKIGKSFISYKSYVHLFIYIPRTFRILRADLVGAIMKMSLVIAMRQITPRIASNEEAGDSYLPLVFSVT